MHTEIEGPKQNDPATTTTRTGFWRALVAAIRTFIRSPTGSSADPTSASTASSLSSVERIERLEIENKRLRSALSLVKRSNDVNRRRIVKLEQTIRNSR